MRFMIMAGALVVGVCLGTAHGGVILSVTNVGSTSNTTTVDVTGPRTFSVDIVVEVTDAFIFSSEANLVASAAGLAEITSFSYNGVVWETQTTGSGGAIDPVIPKATNPPPLPHALPTAAALTTSSVAARSHGRHGSIGVGIDQPGFTGVPASSRLVTLNLLVSETAPLGTYTLNVVRIASGEMGTFKNIGGTGGTGFTLILVPEPATVLLLAAGLFAGLPRRRA